MPKYIAFFVFSKILDIADIAVFLYTHKNEYCEDGYADNIKRESNYELNLSLLYQYTEKWGSVSWPNTASKFKHRLYTCRTCFVGHYVFLHFFKDILANDLTPSSKIKLIASQEFYYSVSLVSTEKKILLLCARYDLQSYT